MYSISGQSVSTPSIQISSSGGQPVSPRFDQALVKPESSGSGSWFNPKYLASCTMAVARHSLAAVTYVGTATATALAAAIPTGTLKLMDVGVQTLGGPQLMPDATTLMSETLAVSHSVGKALHGAVVSTLAPLESSPQKIFDDRERVGQLSRMFDDVQGNNNVPKGQKDILKLMDDLGGSAYRKTGTDQHGQPIYAKMSQEEYRAALLHGAHVVVKGTDVLQQITTSGGNDVIDRSGKGKSSHYTTMDSNIARAQYGMDLPMENVGGPNGGNGFGHLLTGKTSHGDTFFQLEGHGTNTYKQWALHGMDLFTHLNSLANVGPHGVIDMVEGNQTHIVIAPPGMNNVD